MSSPFMVHPWLIIEMWGGCSTWGHLGLGPRCGFWLLGYWKLTLSWTPSACSADNTCPSISDNPSCCPDNLKREKLCYLGTKNYWLCNQSIFKSDDRFVVPGPNGRGSFEAWLAKAPISSHILLFWIGALGVLSRPWIGTCMARTCMKRTF